MYNKFQSNKRAIGFENSYKDKTPEQILIEQRTELFLKAAEKNPQRFRYGAKKLNLKFKYIKPHFSQKK